MMSERSFVCCFRHMHIRTSVLENTNRHTRFQPRNFSHLRVANAKIVFFFLCDE